MGVWRVTGRHRARNKACSDATASLRRKPRDMAVVWPDQETHEGQGGVADKTICVCVSG